jgi:hypothetical protein
MPPAVYYPRCRVALEVLLEDFADGSGEERHSIEVVPRRAEWSRNGRREADTCRVELDWQDFPLDPRAVRSILVAIFCADVGEPDAEIDIDDPDTQVFLGFIDEPEATLEESGETVVLGGRDYTSSFLDHRWPGGAIDITQPLSKVVEFVIAQVPGASDLDVSPSEGAAEVVLADLMGKTKYTPQPDDDTWTVLTDLCGRAGLLAVIELDVLYIRAPFEGQDVQVGFLYGRDVERLVYKRRFNEWKTRQVQVVCWDPTVRESRSATYPQTPIVLRKRISKDGDVTSEAAPLTPFYVEGTYTEAQLLEMAERFWEEAARNEVEVELTTREMADLDYGTLLPRLAAGDQLHVQLGADLAGLASMSQGEATAALEAAGVAPDVAAALIASWRTADNLASAFFIKEAAHSWSRDEGYQLRVTAINYVGEEQG